MRAEPGAVSVDSVSGKFFEKTFCAAVRKRHLKMTGTKAPKTGIMNIDAGVRS